MLLAMCTECVSGGQTWQKHSVPDFFSVGTEKQVSKLQLLNRIWLVEDLFFLLFLLIPHILLLLLLSSVPLSVILRLRLLPGLLSLSHFSPHLLPQVLNKSLPPPPLLLFIRSESMMERRCSQEDDCSSLLSRLGSDSPRPRMKYGGMFCSVEGAFENKTLNFESFSPQMQRRGARGRSEAGETSRGGGQTVVFPSGLARENYGKKEVEINL